MRSNEKKRKLRVDGSSPGRGAVLLRAAPSEGEGEADLDAAIVPARRPGGSGVLRCGSVDQRRAYQRCEPRMVDRGNTKRESA
jgi:hypothetical protein